MKVFAYTVHNLFDHNVGSHLLEAYQEMATCMDDSYFLGYEAAQNDLFLYEQLGDPCRSLMSFIYGDP